METKLLEFNSVMGGGGKQSTVKKYNKVGSEFLDALASLDFTLVSKSVSRQSFGFEAFKPVYMRQKTLDHDQ